MRELLYERFMTPVDLEIVRDIKEKLCYIVSDFDEAIKESEQSHACERMYELPNGSKIFIGSDRFKAAEIYF